ncbi:MAG TPA: PQQ-binding-like beta-propeller repeat protein, partial [Bacteroidota bacterium]|nr:PQQ-binding-like beta-propeller repeat protein [Bacteroidota bacterium]
ICAVDTSNGSIKWVHKVGGPVRSTPAISNGGTIFVASDAGEVMALDSTGNELWYYKDSSSVTSPLLHDGTSLFVGTVSGRILALTDANGNSVSVHSGRDQGWRTYQGSNRRTGNQSDAILLSVRTTNEGVPMAFQLDQNYPNPFNPSTTICFELPQRSRVRLAIFNILGQQIAELADEEMSAGYFERTWIPNVASGMYFYRLEAISTNDAHKRYVDVKKMILLK